MQHVVHRRIVAFVTENQPRRTKASERRGGLPTDSIRIFFWLPWVFAWKLALNKLGGAEHYVALPANGDGVFGELEDVPLPFLDADGKQRFVV